MTSKPILYIVIPCYNEEKVLPETEPLFLQTLRGMISEGKIAEESRVMFVNDGSKDATWDLRRKKSRSRVYVCHVIVDIRMLFLQD